jgi:YlmC/YmxH family sporulation protein
MVKVSDLKTRDVINVPDGRKLGNIVDIDLDLEKGRVTAIVVPGPNRPFSLFTRREDLVIPWERIVKIGHDVILVEASTYTEPRQFR